MKLNISLNMKEGHSTCYNDTRNELTHFHPLLQLNPRYKLLSDRGFPEICSTFFNES